MSAAAHDVRNACQPPALGTSFFATRATSVCQSIDCMSVAFLQELPRLRDVRLGEQTALEALLRLERGAAREQGQADLVVRLVTDDALEEVFLVERPHHGLANLRVVERLVQHVVAERVLAAERIERDELDAGASA